METDISFRGTRKRGSEIRELRWPSERCLYLFFIFIFIFLLGQKKHVTNQSECQHTCSTIHVCI